VFLNRGSPVHDDVDGWWPSEWRCYIALGNQEAIPVSVPFPNEQLWARAECCPKTGLSDRFVLHWIRATRESRYSNAKSDNHGR
jgi:hypothetical protein